MLSSHYHHHKSKTFSQLTQCPFTGTLLLLDIKVAASCGIMFSHTASDTSNKDNEILHPASKSVEDQTDARPS